MPLAKRDRGATPRPARKLDCSGYQLPISIISFAVPIAKTADADRVVREEVYGAIVRTTLQVSYLNRSARRMYFVSIITIFR